MEKLRIGALISGTGSNLAAIMDACADGRIKGEIVFVGSDNPEAQGLARPRSEGIPVFVVPYSEVSRKFREEPDRVPLPDDFSLSDIAAKQQLVAQDSGRDRLRRYFAPRVLCEKMMLDRMAETPFDLLVLAGFMRVLTPYFLDRVNTDPGLPRIMNIHPALLPAFPGTDGYGDTFAYGCKVGGCTVHFVDYGEDTGPIIGQASFPIEPGDTLADVKKKGLELEWKLYPRCVDLFARGLLKVERPASGRRIVRIGR
ncbi:MAG: phosphoribosylglycinamide formyltransferase [Thermodesulfobacteriota bacterium]